MPAAVVLESTIESTQAAADIDGFPEFPAFLLVEHRKPPTPEEQARIDAAMSKVATKQEGDDAIRAQQAIGRRRRGPH